MNFYKKLLIAHTIYACIALVCLIVVSIYTGGFEEGINTWARLLFENLPRILGALIVTLFICYPFCGLLYCMGWMFDYPDDYFK